jgi:hypothetical protein
MRRAGLPRDGPATPRNQDKRHDPRVKQGEPVSPNVSAYFDRRAKYESEGHRFDLRHQK